MIIDFGNRAADPLFDTIEAAGGQMRVVGGAVRDLAVGIQPKDIDFATDLLPEDVMRIMENAGFEVIPTGLAHGTVTVVADKVAYEITTLRADVETDGRHAVVDFVRDFETDAARRDFTINALSADRSGRVFDYFGGLDDLVSGRVRFVGNAEKRVQEDYLRILRYYRFCARFGSHEDEEAVQAIRNNAQGLKRVSVERIWREVSQIFSHPDGVLQLNRMHCDGVTDVIGLPWQPDKASLFEAVRSYTSNPALLVGVICGNEPSADYVALRWKFSLKATDDAMMAAAVICDPSFDPKHWKIRQVEGYPSSVLLPVLCATGRTEAAGALFMEVPVFPIYGRDLIAFGVQPGRELGQMLRDLETKWKDSDFRLSRDDLLEIGKSMAVGEDVCQPKL